MINLSLPELQPGVFILQNYATIVLYGNFFAIKFYIIVK